MVKPKASTSRALTIEVDGARELRTVLKDLGEKKLLRQLAKENRAFAQIVVNEAQTLAHGSRNRIVARGL